MRFVGFEEILVIFCH